MRIRQMLHFLPEPTQRPIDFFCTLPNSAPEGPCLTPFHSSYPDP